MLHLEGGVARQGCLAHITQHGQIKQMVLAQFVGPLRELLTQLTQHIQAAFQLDVVALAVVKRDSLNPFVAGQGMSEASGGVLPTRE